MPGPEQEPAITLNFNNGEVLLPRSRTSIWTFLGRSALDHVFLQESEEHGDGSTRRIGAYLFRDRITSDAFDLIHEAAREYKFEMHENLPDVPESDTEAYINAHSGDIDSFDGVPEGWS